VKDPFDFDRFSPATRRLVDDGINDLLTRIDATTAEVETRKHLYRVAIDQMIAIADARIPGNPHLVPVQDRARSIGCAA
jgi:hypothetical protein